MRSGLVRVERSFSWKWRVVVVCMVVVVVGGWVCMVDVWMVVPVVVMLLDSRRGLCVMSGGEQRDVVFVM